MGNKEPQELLSLDVARLRLKLLKKKAPATVRNIMELLRRIINFVTKKHLCPGISFKIEMPNDNNLKTEDLSPEQLKGLIDAIGNDAHPQAGNLIKMALFTGMRRGELFKLHWNHVDFERGIITIKDPKGGQDQKVPLNDAARDLLKNIPKGKSPLYYLDEGQSSGPILIKRSTKSKPMPAYPKISVPLHGLRHVYASMLASSGEVYINYSICKQIIFNGRIINSYRHHSRESGSPDLLEFSRSPLSRE